MNQLMVYVEGESDRLALTTLMKPLIEKKNSEGIAIEFASVGQSDNMSNNKRALLVKYPRKAYQIMRNNRESAVVLLPDLYPYNVGVPHTSYLQLRNGVMNAFAAMLSESENELKSRFEVFCFKHDLEVLLLAAFDQLQECLGMNIRKTWSREVEEQDDNNPPKKSSRVSSERRKSGTERQRLQKYSEKHHWKTSA
ncbi:MULTISPECIES: DUF4276 family protein [unclassified Mesotoga]|uniref:DUF4276 family protein n=1 Tax=unclassified Mesotoga TaxID=1184398 RepID=UPI000DA67C53|nr:MULTISPECIES: DUF4276 family protein [unclassified Mesotoga]PZC52365.1 hypothetical protein LH53_05245 [Mesotoga sp. TolDC]